MHETLAAERFGVPANRRRIPLSRGGANEALGQRFFTRLDQNARHSVNHGFKGTTASQSDDRSATRL